MLAGRANRVQPYAASATELGARRVLGPATRAVHRRDDTSVERHVGDRRAVERLFRHSTLFERFAGLGSLTELYLTQWHLRREPQNDEIAERRARPFANSPRSHVTAIGRLPPGYRATVSDSPVHDYFHASRVRE